MKEPRNLLKTILGFRADGLGCASCSYGPEGGRWVTTKAQVILEKRPLLIPAIIAAIILLGALGRWPYGYYQLLRWVTCGVAVYVAFLAYAWEKKWATYLFGFIAVLFNPLLPIYLSREIWQPIDVICALLFVVVTFILEKPVEQQRE